MAPVSRFDPATLRSVPLFARLADDQLRRLAGFVCRVRFPAGALLADGTPTDRALRIVVEGVAELREVDHAPRSLGAGDHVGAALLLEEPDRTPIVVAMTDIVIDQISATDFRALLEESPGLALSLLQALSARPDETLPDATPVRTEA